MRKSTAFATLGAVSLVCPVIAAEGPVPLTEAMITQVVNQVEVIPGGNGQPTPAQMDSLFRAPDMLKTGRKSRAQLTAPDGTVARIGSNTVFAFENQGRTLNLQQGSVLFNSPAGKGGGTIVTASASASVLGTTLIVAATADGGFKVLVLEGKARVDFASGQSQILNAGQMTFVLPQSQQKQEEAKGGEAKGGEGKAEGKVAEGKGTEGAKAEGEKQGPSTAAAPAQPKAEGERTTTAATTAAPAATTTPAAAAPTVAELPVGRPGPVINFDLGAQAKTSNLVNGFTAPLPSLPKVEAAVVQQRENTNLLAPDRPVLILGAASEDNITVADASMVTAALDATKTVQDPIDRALATSVVVNGPTSIPSSNIFTTPTALSADRLGIPASLMSPDDDLGQFIGVIAGSITFDTPHVDLTAASSLPYFHFLGTQMAFRQCATFDAYGSTQKVGLYAKQLTLPAGTNLTAVFHNPTGITRFTLQALNTVVLDGGSMTNPTGTVEVSSGLNDFGLKNAACIEGGFLNSGTSGDVWVSAESGLFTIADSAVLRSQNGTVTVSASRVDGSGGKLESIRTIVGGNSAISVKGSNSLSLQDTGLYAYRVFLNSSGDIFVKNPSLSPSMGDFSISSSGGKTTLISTSISAPNLVMNVQGANVVANGVGFYGYNQKVNIGSPTTTTTNVNYVGLGSSTELNVGSGSVTTVANLDTSNAYKVGIYGPTTVMNNITIPGATTVRANATDSITASTMNVNGGSTIELTSRVISVDSLTVSATGSVLKMFGTNQATLTNLSATSTMDVSMSARTITLQNVSFQSGSTVNFTCQTGMLAANPNTGASVVPGHVNFVNNVNYGGSPAQFFVPVSQGGQHVGTGAPINITSGSF